MNDTILGMPVPKQGPTSLLDAPTLSPTSLMVCRMLGGVDSGKLLRVLFDSGGAHTMIHKRVLPPTARIDVDPNGKRYNTIAGPFVANRSIAVQDFILPEIDRSKRIQAGAFKVFDIPDCPHDVLLGREVLLALGMIIDFDIKAVKWMDQVVRMKKHDHWRSSTNTALALDAKYLDSLHEDGLDDAFILDAKYEASSARQVAEARKHLNKDQQD